MADYSAPALRGSGSLNDYGFVSGETYTFTLLRPPNNSSETRLSGSGAFTYETVRNTKGFYDQGAPKYASGTHASPVNLHSLISSSESGYGNYIFSYILYGVTSSFEWTANQNVPVGSVYFRCVGDYEMTVLPDSTGVSPTPSPTKTMSVTPSITPESTPSVSISPSLTPSLTPSITISTTPSPSLSLTPSLTPTVTPSISSGQTRSNFLTTQAGKISDACNLLTTTTPYYLSNFWNNVSIGDIVYTNSGQSQTFNGGGLYYGYRSTSATQPVGVVQIQSNGSISYIQSC
jgi:hypothetical protein